MNKFYFLLGIHNHQPVGNFPEVFEEAFNKSYWPYIQLMKKHPRIKWSLHCSGILWDFFMDKHPEYIQAVKDMVNEGRLELISGGYYEPVLPAIPDIDKKGQILKLTKFIKDEFKQDATGIWLTERVWEPGLAKILSESGIKYTVVDDAHFAASGEDIEKLKGYYVTEDQGEKLNIFPISQLMRYYIPFKPVEYTIGHFSESLKNTYNPTLVMADDGEKFGLWPGTYKHVYQDGWLNNFFDALDRNQEWVETITFAEYMKKFPPEGRIYLPTASYFEMSEWSLPYQAQSTFESVVKQYENNNDVKRFLRGGFWRNFLTKYAESNNMHKKMLYVSKKINEALKIDKCLLKKDTAKKPVLTAEETKGLNAMYAGQCNCAYWHGVFGGLYLPHLRNAIYKQLIEAESFLAKKLKAAKWTELDFDCDGNDEVIYESKEQNLYISPNSGGSIFEWDILSKKVNLLNTLTRRPEAYHKRLREFIANKGGGCGSGVKTIHDMVSVKEENLDKYLDYDWYKRASLLDHFIHPDTSFEGFRKCKFGEQGDFVLSTYEKEISGSHIKLKRQGDVWINNEKKRFEVEKTITPVETGIEITYAIKNLQDQDLSVVFAPEFNFAFSYFKEEEKAVLENITEWSHKDAGFGMEVSMKFSKPARFWAYPLETVSLSENGFERTYQGTVAVPVFKLDIGHLKASELKIKVKIK
jgi:alpha-amylase